MADSKPPADVSKQPEAPKVADPAVAPAGQPPPEPAKPAVLESANPAVAEPAKPAQDAGMAAERSRAEPKEASAPSPARTKEKAAKRKGAEKKKDSLGGSSSKSSEVSGEAPVKKKEFIVVKKGFPDVLGPEDRMMAGHHGWERADSQIRSDTMKTYVNTIESDELYPLRRYELHGHKIWEHQAQKDPKPQPPIMVTEAFGNFMFSKMVRVLKHRDLIVRQKAMVWAVELLSVPEDCSRCFAAGIVAILARMFREEDLFIRQQLALCFRYITVRKVGAIEASRLGAIQGLVHMLKDNDTTLRTNAFHALLEAAHYEIVRKELVNDGTTLEFFLKKVDEEREKTCLILGLDLLSKCLDTGTDNEALSQLLKANAVLSSIRHLAHLDPSVKESAAQFLCLLCMDKSAKAQAVANKAVKILIPLLDDIEPRVQALAAGALMSMTIDIDGKKAFITENGVPVCVNLMDELDERLCLNILELMTNVAEHPTARLGYGTCPGLQNGISVCDRLIANTFTGMLTKRCAVSCKEMLNFRHRPFNIEHAHR